MATTRENIFSFDTSRDVDNLKTLKAEIRDLKKALDELEIGSEDYNKTSERLWERQSRLKDVMKETQRPLEDAAGSYNALNKELVELRKTYRSLSEAERESDFGADILLKIQDLDKKLKDSDASMGQYFRNVGNYSGGILDAFGKMGMSVGSLNEPLRKIGVDIESIDTSAKLLQGTLNIFTGQNLAMLQQMLGSVTSGTQAFIAGLSGIKKAILATGIGALVVALGAIVAYWDDIREAISSVKTPEEEIVEETNEFLEAMEDSTKEADRLAELMGVLGASELEIAAYRAGKLRDRLHDTNVELDDQKSRLSELNVWWRRIGRAILSVLQYIIPVSDSMRQLFGSKSEIKGLEESIKKTTEAVKNLSEQSEEADFKEYLAGVKEEIKAKEEAERAAEKAAEAARKEAEDRKKAAEEAEKEQKKLRDTMLAAYEARKKKAKETADAITESLKTEREKEEEDYKEKLELLEEFNLDTRKLTESHKQKMKELDEKDAKESYDRKLKQLESEAAIEQLKSGTGTSTSGNFNYEETVAQNNAEYEATAKLINGKIALNNELLENYEEDSEEYREIMRQNDELAAELDAADRKRKQKNKDATVKLEEQKLNATKIMASGTSTILKNLSSIMGENTKMGKGFAIASATIDTIAAAVSGFRAGYNQWKDTGMMAWMAPVQGALNATMALTAGFAQVQKIRNVDTSGSDSGGGASAATALAMPNIEGLSSPVDYTRQVTTDTEQEQLNRDNRVYILESDIQESGNRVRVREEETTF